MRVGRGQRGMIRLGHVRKDAPYTALLLEKSYSQTYIICAVRRMFVARTLLLLRRHREEQLLDAAIAPVAGSFQSSSAAAACLVTNWELALRFGINMSNQRDLLGTLHRVSAAGHAQEAWWAALQ